MKPAVCPCVNDPLPFQSLYEDLAKKKKKKSVLRLIFHTRQMEENEGDVAVAEIVEKEEFQTDIAGSSEMELNISHILEKIERFTQLVAMFNTTPYVAG